MALLAELAAAHEQIAHLERLRRSSQDSHRKLRDIAVYAVDNGSLSEPSARARDRRPDPTFTSLPTAGCARDASRTGE